MNSNQETNQNQSENNETFVPIEQPKNSRNIIIIVLLCLVLILTGVIAYLNLPKKEVDNAPKIILNGESTISITEGHDYTEPGYSATNYEGIDITSSVVVEGKVDTNKVGSYELTYTIMDNGKKAIIKRNVVVKKISLSLFLLGESTTNILKGETYVEPGFDAFDEKDGNLTSKVVVTGSVDSNTLGIYTLTYTITNSNNDVIKKERIINVIATPVLKISADINDKVITINVTGKNYSYILLPDKTKVTTKTAFYEITESGTYIFEIYDVEGNKYAKEIVANLTPIKLGVDEMQVKNLYNSISSMIGNFKNFYQTVKVTKTNVSRESLLEGAYLSLGKPEATNDEIKNQIKKIYDLDIEIPTTTVMFGDSTEISYSSDKWMIAGTSISGHQNGVIKEVIKEGNFLYIYDTYRYIDFLNAKTNVLANSELTKVYSGSDKKIVIGKITCKVDACAFEQSFHDENNDTITLAGEQTYKHTFRLKEDGTYYWVSSEPNSNLNLTDEQVLKLYNYISSANGNFKNFYQTIKVTKANATKESLLEGAFLNVNDNEPTNSELQEMAKDLYNLTASIVIPTTTKVEASNMKIYYENGKWLQTGTTYNSHVIGELIKAENIGNYIYLYDGYQYIDYDNINTNVLADLELTKVYSGSDKKHVNGTINCKVDACTFSKMGVLSTQDQIINNASMTLYKHTFRLKDDGSYYWLSSEPVV